MSNGTMSRRDYIFRIIGQVVSKPYSDKLEHKLEVYCGGYDGHFHGLPDIGPGLIGTDDVEVVESAALCQIIRDGKLIPFAESYFKDKRIKELLKVYAREFGPKAEITHPILRKMISHTQNGEITEEHLPSGTCSLFDGTRRISVKGEISDLITAYISSIPHAKKLVEKYGEKFYDELTGFFALSNMIHADPSKADFFARTALGQDPSIFPDFMKTMGRIAKKTESYAIQTPTTMARVVEKIALCGDIDQERRMLKELYKMSGDFLYAEKRIRQWLEPLREMNTV